MINLAFPGLLAACLAAIISLQAADAAMTFTPGHFYSSDPYSLRITEYDPAGKAIGFFDVAPYLAEGLHGITFGPDGLLYAAAERTSGSAVLAFDSSGALKQTYEVNVSISGNLAYGKVAVDNQHVFVAGGDSLTRFDLGKPASQRIFHISDQTVDVEILPSGNLLVASAYNIYETTASGTVVQQIKPQGAFFSDIAGIEYNPATNDLFVTHFDVGPSQILRLDATSGVVEKSVDFEYANDLFLTGTGDLLAGSRTQTPGIYTQELARIGTLGSGSQTFVTQYPIPEPGTCASAAIACMALACIHRRRQTYV